MNWIANNDNGGSSSSSSAPAVSDAAGRQAAYQNGLAAGRRQGTATAAKKAPATAARRAPAAAAPAPKTGSGFKAGSSYTLNGIKSSGAYFVQIGPGGQGLRIGPHVAARAGQTYWLCGSRVCYSAR